MKNNEKKMRELGRKKNTDRHIKKGEKDALKRYMFMFMLSCYGY